MSKPKMEALLEKAIAKERKYDWLGAIDYYAIAESGFSSEHFFELGNVLEHLGYANYRWAMQAEGIEEFKERCKKAIENYEKACRLFLQSANPLKSPRVLRCEALIAYVNYWLAPDTAQKKAHTNECWRLTKEALKAFEGANDPFEFGTTYNRLVDSALLSFFLEWNFRARERTAKEAMDLGEQAAKWLSGSGDAREQAKAFAKALVCTSVFAYNFLDVSEREKKYERVLAYWSKAKQLDEEVAILETLYPFFGPNIVCGVEGTDEAISNFKRALNVAQRASDWFLVGSAFDWLTYHTAWAIRKTEDADKQQELSKDAREYARKAKESFARISFTSPRDDLAWIEDTSQIGPFSSIVVNETDLRKKRMMVKDALEALPAMTTQAQNSGYPEAALYVHHMSSFILTAQSKLETSAEERKTALERALVHRESSLKIISQIQPFMYWNRGTMHTHMATVRYELAELTLEPKARKAIILKAIANSNASSRFRNRDLAFYKSKGSTEALTAQIAENQFLHGNLWMQLYNTTKDKIDAEKAIQSYMKALGYNRRSSMTSRVAECYWKIALIFDDLAEHLRSAQNFKLASRCYEKAGERIPQLKRFYEDHATYMLSWSEIEKARHNHRKQNYSRAKKHFKKAAELHEGLKQWAYLASTYSAWAMVEQGEELSRKDRTEEAMRAFDQAAEQFTKTGQSVESHLPGVESSEERTMATNVLRGTDLRYRYCLVRIGLEEGRLLDKRGDHFASSERYGKAAQDLEKIEVELEYEHDRKEFRFLIMVSRAWEKMMLAEAESSTDLYKEASKYFERAREFGPNERSIMLVLGHSQFCKALGIGMRIADVMDKADYEEAKGYLKSAADCYAKAGFSEASQYAEATGLLFDAYWHIDRAKKERYPREKAKGYVAVEKVLQRSANAFTKAEHLEKRDQVIGILERVREVRELATSLADLLSASRIASARTVLTVPTPTYEQAVGLERFEHADVRANLSARQKLRVGEDFDLELELVNAGKGPALLTKIKGVIPEGFKLIREPEPYHVEGSFLNLRGKRLDPLKTEDVRIALKPRAQGVFALEPVVLYLDENGRYKSSETNPITLTVRGKITRSAESSRNLVDTGLTELDNMLYGGIEPNSAVILTSALGDERAALVESFLGAGVKRKQTSLYVTTRVSGMQAWIDKSQSNLCLLICNAQAEGMVGDLPNVFKLRGVESLTEIGIAIGSVLSKLTMPSNEQRRACIEIVSDVLLQHNALDTRRWLNALIPQLKAKGFTILAAMNPQMHPSKDVHAVLDIFDGEASIYERETGKRSERFLRIIRMQNQEHSGDEVRLGVH